MQPRSGRYTSIAIMLAYIPLFFMLFASPDFDVFPQDEIHRGHFVVYSWIILMAMTYYYLVWIVVGLWLSQPPLEVVHWIGMAVWSTLMAVVFVQLGHRLAQGKSLTPWFDHLGPRGDREEPRP